MELDEGWLEGLLKKAGKAVKVLSVRQEAAVGAGENYGSRMIRLRLEVEPPSGGRSPLTLVLKAQPESPAVAQFLQEFFIFRNEITMYGHVFPAFEKLMAEHGDQSEKLWCHCLGYKEYDCILMEDLKASGFTTTDKTKGLDLEHAVLALQGIARFHALSYMLIHSKKIDIENLLPQNKTQNIANPYFRTFIDTLLRVIRSSWGENWSEMGDKLELVMSDFGIKLDEMRRLDPSKMNVITHGDFWSNNIMYKYDQETGIPQDLRLLDFQLAHYNSYGWDVVQLLHTSMFPEVKRRHYEELVSAYHAALTATFEAHSFRCSRVPTLDEVRQEMARLEFLGLILTCCYLPATLSSTDQAFDNEAVVEDQETDHNAKMYTNEKYIEGLKQELQHYFCVKVE